MDTRGAGPLGARIAAARRAAGLTQVALARAAGIDRTALSKVEHGRRNLGPHELARLASALRLSVDDLLATRRRSTIRTLADLRRRRRAIARIADRHGARRLRVFGSVARGDARADSDIDLLVDLARGRTLLDQAALLVDLKDLLGREVDVVTEEGLRLRIRERVLREAVPL